MAVTIYGPHGERGPEGPAGPSGVTEAIAFFGQDGTLTVGTGAGRFDALGETWAIISVVAVVNTAPTGADLIVDVNKNGTTIFTTQANRPTIAVSTNRDTADAIDVTTFSGTDFLTVDIDQVGSTVAGSDLTVQVLLRKS